MTIKDDIYLIANRLKIDHLELIAFAIGLQEKYDQIQSKEHWKQILECLNQNKTDEKTVETLNYLHKGIRTKEVEITNKKESGKIDLADEIKELEKIFEQLIEIINKIKSETKL